MGGSSKKVTVGYRYFLGVHMILCHGPVDKLIRILVDKRSAWSGASTGGQININAENLFGGESREGGISGAVDVEMGGSSQGQNSYLLSKIGSGIPSFRGVMGVVLRQVYMGINPYLKTWAFRVQRIHKRQNGITQWYDEKAEPPSTVTQGAVETYTSFTSGWSTNAPTKFQIVDGMIANTLINANNADYYRIPAPAFTITGLYCEFKLINRDLGDPLGIRFDTAGGGQLFGFMPQAEDAFDPGRRRPHVNYWTTPIPIYENELAQGVLYSFEAQMDNDAGTYTYFLRQGSTLLATGTAPLPAGTPAYVTFGRTSNAFPDRTGIAGYSKLIVSGYVKSGDMNPAHIIRECLTDPDWGMGYQESDIDDASFQAAADTMYAEGMGISLLWDKQVPLEDFIKEIIRHISAALYVDRKSGKFVLKLIREDYIKENLLVLGEDEIQRVQDYSRPSFGELVNSVTANFWDSATGTTSSITADDPALIQMQGAVIGTTIQYPGFTNGVIAAKCAMRALRTLSTPMLTCTIYANKVAADLNIGDPFLFEWPDYHEGQIVMRVTGLGLGDGKSNAVRITCAQDTFDLPKVTVVTPEVPDWTDPTADPVPAQYRAIVEAPYYELVQRLGQTTADNQLGSNMDLGYILASAAAPSGAINGRLAIDAGAGYDGNDTAMDFCPAAFLAADITPGQTSISITGGQSLSAVTTGTHAQIGNELVKVTALTDTTLTAGRGVLDTVPAAHAAGTPVLFWDAYADSDDVEYVAGEALNVKILPTTGNGTLDVADAPTDVLTFASRAYRPYPPGNLKIGGVAYPVTIGGSTEFSASWSHRDRLQQTAGDIVDTTVGNIGPEAGTTYTLKIYKEDGVTLLHTETGTAFTSYTYPAATELAEAMLPGEGSQSYSQVVNQASPTAYWRMGEASGTAMTDSTGHGYGGTYSSVTLGQTGAVPGDTAAAFNGSSSSAQVAHNAALNPGTGEYAIEMWAKFTGTTYGMAFGKFSTSSPFTGPTVFFNYFNDVQTAGRIEFRDERTSGYWVDSASSGLNDGNWRHYIFQRRKVSTGPDVWKLEMYINGVLDASTTLATVKNLSNTEVTYVGSRPAQYINGTFDEVAYYVGKALTPTEAANHYAARNGIASSYRLNGKLRMVLESVRSGYTSFQAHDYTVKRTGYGFNYGEFYGGV